MRTCCKLFLVNVLLIHSITVPMAQMTWKEWLYKGANNFFSWTPKEAFLAIPLIIIGAWYVQQQSKETSAFIRKKFPEFSTHGYPYAIGETLGAISHSKQPLKLFRDIARAVSVKIAITSEGESEEQQLKKALVKRLTTMCKSHNQEELSSALANLDKLIQAKYKNPNPQTLQERPEDPERKLKITQVRAHIITLQAILRHALDNPKLS